MTHTVLAARCISCGCDDAHACGVEQLDGTVRGCWWVLVDNAKGLGLCSACATIAQVVYVTLPLTEAESLPVLWLASFLPEYSDAEITAALQELETAKLATRGAVDLVHGGPRWYRTEVSP